MRLDLADASSSLTRTVGEALALASSSDHFDRKKWDSVGVGMGEVEWFLAYDAGRATRAEAQLGVGCSRSTFFRRLARFRQGGPRRLAHGLRGRPRQHLASVRRQVVALYQREPSLFCAHFYRRNRQHFVRHVAYSTVRHWLREAKVLRRFPRGSYYAQEQLIWGRRVPCQLLQPGELPPTVQAQRLRRNLPWQIRERWEHVWLGWEKPGWGCWPSPEERESFAFWQTLRRTALRRAYRRDDVEDLIPKTPLG